jgi:diacylglycerol kinase
MKKQLLSFWYAIYGILGALKTEAHLRFHVVAAVFVLIFAGICGFSAERFAVLLLLIGAVIALELVNTSVEHACNAVTRQFNAHIKLAKDLAAAAVLVMAAVAVAVAAMFFLNADAWNRVCGFFAAYPWAAVPLAALAALSVWFVAKCKGNEK